MSPQIRALDVKVYLILPLEFGLNVHRWSRYTGSSPVARHPSVDAMQSEWVPRTVLLEAKTAWLSAFSGALPSLRMPALQQIFVGCRAAGQGRLSGRVLPSA
jgi:hypothetical protein